MSMSDCTRVAILSTMLVLAVYIAPATADVITFTSFPNGDPIPDGTVVSNQFEPLGVRFQPLFPDSPRVLSALGGVLISGGPTGFFGDIGIEFLTPISSVTVDIIGSGFDIAARLEAFNGRGLTLGAATHTYTGVTGLPSSFSFFAPDGDSIARCYLTVV
jgi:hypothetical protein